MDVDPKPHVQMVAFPRPFDRWYGVADRSATARGRVWWGKNSAKES